MLERNQLIQLLANFFYWLLRVCWLECVFKGGVVGLTSQDKNRPIQTKICLDVSEIFLSHLRERGKIV